MTLSTDAQIGGTSRRSPGSRSDRPDMLHRPAVRGTSDGRRRDAVKRASAEFVRQRHQRPMPVRRALQEHPLRDDNCHGTGAFRRRSAWHAQLLIQTISAFRAKTSMGPRPGLSQYSRREHPCSASQHLRRSRGGSSEARPPLRARGDERFRMNGFASLNPSDELRLDPAVGQRPGALGRPALLVHRLRQFACGLISHLHRHLGDASAALQGTVKIVAEHFALGC